MIFLRIFMYAVWFGVGCAIGFLLNHTVFVDFTSEDYATLALFGAAGYLLWLWRYKL